jgi:hypothetical protein
VNRAWLNDFCKTRTQSVKTEFIQPSNAKNADFTTLHQARQAFSFLVPIASPNEGKTTFALFSHS